MYFFLNVAEGNTIMHLLARESSSTMDLEILYEVASVAGGDILSVRNKQGRTPYQVDDLTLTACCQF
jgi:hypothetical protein